MGTKLRRNKIGQMKRKTRADECRFKNVLETRAKLKKNLNPVAFVRERTIPTKRPPLFGEVSVNFCG
jgi:hypothetical protein